MPFLCSSFRKLALAVALIKLQGQTLHNGALPAPNDLFWRVSCMWLCPGSVRRTALWFWLNRDYAMASKVSIPE